MDTLKEMSRAIGDLFLTCRQQRYLADAAGDPEAVKAWDATGNHLAEALLAADRAGPCAVCGRRTDIRCTRCDTLLCQQACADYYHWQASPHATWPENPTESIPCHLPERPKVKGAPCLDQEEDIGW